MPTEPRPREETLREWVRANEVCWEIAPHYEVHEHVRLPVGFDLTLFARRPAACTSDPGCAACAEAHEVLREIALAVLPRDVHCEIEPFDAAFHLRPENRWEPELDLVVEVLHEGTFETADAGERDRAKAVTDALVQLGAQPRVWRRAR